MFVQGFITEREDSSATLATEASSLSSSSFTETNYGSNVYTSSPHRRPSPQTSRKVWAIIQISSLFVYILCMCTAGFLFARGNSYHNNLHSNKNARSNVRQDFVENYSPEKHTIIMTSPPMHLDMRHDIYLHSSNLRASLVSFGLHNRQDEQTSNESASLRWAILGAGRIAHDFTSVLVSSGCTVTAVASSHNYNGEENLSALSRAKSFASLFSIPKYYGTYEELAKDTNIDIVYVATTNQNHMKPTLLMLRSGKNVLVEKPTAITYDEGKIMYDEAQRRGLFLMTNHWTRFFPLVKYFRSTFLQLQSSSDDTAPVPEIPALFLLAKQWMLYPTPSHTRKFNLGKVLAMHGDFSFQTPLDPSDRFLNRTLGGGVTLDVGCYLIELALLAAYDHHRSNFDSKAITEDRRTMSSEELHPEQVIATGHGIYDGLEFPVDVESSFSMRWGGRQKGIWNGTCAGTDSTSLINRRGCDLSKSNSQYSSDDPNSSSDEFTMLASFQASFRRPSPFEVEYVFENGRVVLSGPANCPNQLTIFENEPSGPMHRETKVEFKLPTLNLSPFGRPNYPRTEGFVYVIDRIEQCMAEKGVPGRRDVGTSKCLELEENSIEEQLATVQITEHVLQEMNYFS